MQELQEKVSKFETRMRRACNLLADYKDALQQSLFNSKKVPSSIADIGSHTHNTTNAGGTAPATSHSNNHFSPAATLTNAMQTTGLLSDKLNGFGNNNNNSNNINNTLSNNVNQSKDDRNIITTGTPATGGLNRGTSNEGIHTTTEQANNPRSTWVPPAMIQLIVCTPAMDSALKRLQDLLLPFAGKGTRKSNVGPARPINYCHLHIFKTFWMCLKNTVKSLHSMYVILMAFTLNFFVLTLFKFHSFNTYISICIILVRQVIDDDDDDQKVNKPSDEVAEAAGEQQRQLRVMFAHVRSLQTTIDLNYNSVNEKVLEKISENEELLSEINELRMNVSY